MRAKVVATGALLALFLSGCAGLEVKPLDKEAKGIDTADELPPGPGLFTGEGGNWVVGTEM